MGDFAADITKAYAVDGPCIDLGRGVLGDETHPDALVRVPLAMMNRHGLVAGATGTGKTRTLQVLAEQLSGHGVAVLVADVKGDLSGLADPGDADPEGAAARRAANLGVPFEPTGYPVEYLSLGGIGAGVPVRATVSDWMAPTDDVAAAATASALNAKYGTRLDRQSAREILAGRLEASKAGASVGESADPAPATTDHVPYPKAPKRRKTPAGDAVGRGSGGLGDFLDSRQGKTLQREVVRGVFSMLRKRL